jgi:hypothetical protein
MKKSLILGLLGLAASVVPSFGQGTIFVDNYFTSGPTITYGAGVAANGVNGAPGTPGTGLLAGWTMGIYWALGNVTGSIAADPSGMALISSLGGGLALATGAGSTADLFTSSFGTPGRGFSGSFLSLPGTSAAGGQTITVITVAYGGSSYDTAGFRGHSTAFTMVTSAGTSSSPNALGASMPAFSIDTIPEPSSFALMGISGVAWLIVRRQKLV